MKKILAALLSLMMVSIMAISVSAKAWIWDFSYDVPGEKIEDLSPKFYPIDGAHQGPRAHEGAVIVGKDLDGNIVAEMTHPAREAGYPVFFRSMDPGGSSDYGSNFVIQYDIYLAPAGEPSDTSQVMWFDSYKFPDGEWMWGAEIMTDGRFVDGTTSTVLTTVEFNKWINIATAFDFVNGTYSIYLNEELMAEDIEIPNDSPAISYANIGYGDYYSDEAVVYFDNLKAYSGSSPEDYIVETKPQQTTKDEETTPDATQTTDNNATTNNTTDQVSESDSEKVGSEDEGAPIGLVAGIAAAVVVVAVVVIVVVKKKKA